MKYAVPPLSVLASLVACRPTTELSDCLRSNHDDFGMDLFMSSIQRKRDDHVLKGAINTRLNTRLPPLAAPAHSWLGPAVPSSSYSLTSCAGLHFTYWSTCVAAGLSVVVKANLYFFETLLTSIFMSKKLAHCSRRPARRKVFPQPYISAGLGLLL